jgi:hypothetical protein
MRFSDTTQKAILKLWLDGVSMAQIAACYTTSQEAVERIIRLQLRTKGGK